MDTTIDLANISIDTSSPALVTGATGYVASWIVKGLLDAGVSVHAAVRDPHNTAKVQYLLDLAKDAPGTLTLFAGDLLKEGSYAEAMAGCAVVFHTASPFVRNVQDAQRDLVDPAVKGTRNVLETANATASVRRVVLTSSVASIYTDNAECAQAPGGVLTEEVWNNTASLTHEPYNFSKVQAEREAWKIADAQHRWQLVVINPSLVIGPALNPNPTSESFAIVKMYGDGTMRFGAPKLGMGVVDVRDVARAHIAAGYLPQVEGRHITSGHNTDTLAMARPLQSQFGGKFPLPKRALPKPLVWLVAPAITMTRDYVSKNVDVPFRGDNSKSARELGMKYRPLSESMNDMFGQMVERGVFAKK